MLVIKVELWPFGNAKAKKKLGEIRLWNKGRTFNKEGFSYQAEGGYTSYPDGKKRKLDGCVLDYDRKHPNVWKLVFLMLQDMLKKEEVFGEQIK